jgi:hypothetical protein
MINKRTIMYFGMGNISLAYTIYTLNYIISDCHNTEKNRYKQQIKKDYENKILSLEKIQTKKE